MKLTSKAASSCCKATPILRLGWSPKDSKIMHKCRVCENLCEIISCKVEELYNDETSRDYFEFEHFETLEKENVVSYGGNK